MECQWVFVLVQPEYLISAFFSFDLGIHGCVFCFRGSHGRGLAFGDGPKLHVIMNGPHLKVAVHEFLP